MTSEAQRIKIAEACGWTFITSDPKYPHGLPPKGKHNTYTSPLPDYLNDLNAIHAAIAALPFDQQINVAELLTGDLVEVMQATAAQRCEAFLRTINKWTNDN